MASVEVENPVEQSNNMVQENSETKASKTKTQESIDSKGDKSYYYWHKFVPNTVPINSPTLLSKTVIEQPQEPTYTKVINYSWMDDESLVKVYVEFAKIGDPNVAATVNKDNITCAFNEQGFDLIIRDYRGHHQLKISNLKEDIDHATSTFKVLSSKIIVSLKKKEESKSWHELVKKNKD